MPNPKNRMSKSRRDKRRAQFNARTKEPGLATCPVTGEKHLSHRAHWHEDKLYYNGKVIMTKSGK